MINKTDTETPNIPTSPAVGGLIEDFKDSNSKYNLSKFEYDLYHEEDDVAESVVRIKRVPLPNKGEKWKVFSDNKVVFIVEGSKLNNRERDFLKTVDGINWFLSQAKIEIKSFNAFKKSLKAHLLKILSK